MASAKQLKALLKSYGDGDEAQFYSVAMQLAAHEARLGHGKLARELRDLIDKAKTLKSTVAGNPIPLTKPRGELSGLLSASYPKLKLADMVLSHSVGDRLRRLIKEQTQVRKIRFIRSCSTQKAIACRPARYGQDNDCFCVSWRIGPATVCSETG